MNKHLNSIAAAVLVTVGLLGLASCQYLALFDAQPDAAKAAEISLLQTAIDGVGGVIAGFISQTPPPTWLVDAKIALHDADGAFEAAETAYRSGSGDAGALLGAAESQVGTLFAFLSDHGITVKPATLTALVKAKGLHKASAIRAGIIR